MIHLESQIKIISDAKISQPRWLRIRSSDFIIQRPNTDIDLPKATREYFQSRNAVSGVIHCPSTEQVLMLRQFRFPVYADTQCLHASWIYEHVAGLIEDHETPEQNFIREVEEESGVILDPSRVNLVASYYVSPGFVDEQHLIYVAEVDSPQELPERFGLESEAEAIIAEWQTYDQIRELVKGVHDSDGNLHKIVDGKTLMSLIKIGLA